MNGHTRSEKHKMLHYHFHEKKGEETIHELPIQNVPTALVKMLTENSRKNISCTHGLAILEEASPDYQSINDSARDRWYGSRVTNPSSPSLGGSELFEVYYLLNCLMRRLPLHIEPALTNQTNNSE